MRIKLIVLLCIGMLCSSSIKDEEGRYESKPPYRSFILENYTEESAKHYFDSSVRSEIPVGTILGYLTRGVNPNTCFIWLYKHKLTGAILYAPKRFSARLTSDLNGILFSGNSAKKLEDLFDPRSGFIKLYPKQISEDSENREIRYL